MTYSYDRRTASDDKAQEHLENVAARCGEAAEDAERILNELDKRTESDALSKPRELAEMIVDNLRTAEGQAPKLSDIVACVRDAKEDLGKLEAALKVAKKEAKSDEKDEVALEAIADAADYIKDLKRAIREIDSEIADAPEPEPDPESE